MKNNLYIWSKHYKDYLVKYHQKFNILLNNYGEEPISYPEFVLFCYQNTKKTVIHIPGLISKELHAPLL